MRRSTLSRLSMALVSAAMAAGLATGARAASPAASATASAAGPAGAASDHPVLDRIRARGYVVLAHREASVPFSYVLPGGQPVGYALDLCKRLVEAVGKELKIPSLGVHYLLVQPSDRLQAVADGRADFECGSTTNNAARRQLVAFTVPHYITGARIAERAGAPYEQLEQFEGHNLVSTLGTTPLAAIQRANDERLLRIHILTAPDHDQAMAMVADGRADGFAMDDVLLYGLIASQPDPSKFKVVGKFLTIEPLAIALSKSDPALKRIADEEMKHLIRDGEAEALYQRWFMQPIPPRGRALNLPMSYLLKDFWQYPSDIVPN